MHSLGMYNCIFFPMVQCRLHGRVHKKGLSAVAPRPILLRVYEKRINPYLIFSYTYTSWISPV